MISWSLNVILPRLGAYLPVITIEESGFSCSVGADDSVSLALFKVQVDSKKDFQSAKVLEKTRYLQQAA